MPLFDKGIRLICTPTLSTISTPFGIINVRNYAARKGTRAKRAKSKVKVEVQKVGFIPHNQRNLEAFLKSRPKMKFDDSWRQKPLDNVYPQKYYQWKVYPFQEAIQNLKETNHPEMYNNPNANVHVNIELNMEGEKKNKFLDNIYRIAAIPHVFEHGEERAVIAFAKDESKLQAARAAGAALAGGVELIKDIQNGQIALSDFQFVVAEPAILAELVILRGLMKKRFPNPKSGTLDDDVPNIVTRLVNGINYMGLKDEYEKDFGIVKTVIGTLNMDGQQLEGNFAALVRDVYANKPKRDGPFITRCLLWSPPNKDKLKVDHNLYLDTIATKTTKKEDKEKVDDVQGAVAQ